jgi:hypothetical protein
LKLRRILDWDGAALCDDLGRGIWSFYSGEAGALYDPVQYCGWPITVKGLTWNHRSTSATSVWKAARSVSVIVRKMNGGRNKVKLSLKGK